MTYFGRKDSFRTESFQYTFQCTKSFLLNEILRMKLFFISILFSISNANYGLDGLRGNSAVERRSSVILFKPYVLDFVNSRAMAKLKKTACFPNLHYILSNNDFHYMGHLPVFRALFRERIPAFINFWKNLKLGPSATKGKIYSIKTLNWTTQPVIALNVLFNEFWKGVLKNLWKIPAFKRITADPNMQKLFHCSCWPQGCVQCI